MTTFALTVRRSALATCVAGVGLVAAACGPSKSATENRLWTPSYSMRVTTEPEKPAAEISTRYKIVVLDKKTDQPVEAGEGRIFGTNASHLNVDDGLAKGKEVGTYYANLRFPMSGDWALAIQFRRLANGVAKDTLEQTLDWRTTVLPAPPIGQQSQ